MGLRLAAIGLESVLLKYHDISPCIKKIIVKRINSFYYKELQFLFTSF